MRLSITALSLRFDLGRPKARALLRHLSLNTLWLLLARLGSHGLMVLFTLIVARSLGEAGLGEYALMVAVVFLGNALTSFGTDMYLVREIAARRALSLLPPALLLQGALSALLIAAIFLLPPQLPHQRSEAALALRTYSLALFPLAFFTVFSAALRGLERMGTYAILSTAAVMLQVVAAWMALGPGGTLLDLARLMLLAHTLAAILAGVLCVVQIPGFERYWRLPWRGLIPLARASAPIGLLGVLGVLFLRLNVYLLATLEGTVATGHYAAASRIVEAARLLPIAAFGALFPLMARSRTSAANAAAMGVIGLSWRSLTLLSAALAVLLSVSAPFLILLLFGPEFWPAVAALQILAWSLIPGTLSIYLSLDLLARGEERRIALALIVAILVLAAVAAVWIPRFSTNGAAAALLIGEIAYAGSLAYLRRRATVSQRELTRELP